MICEKGIFVFESKNYSGWIFGDEDKLYCYQTLPRGRRSKKEHFYNPIMQNQGHIRALRSRLPQNPNTPIYSIIVFYGNCFFRNVTYYSTDTYILHPHEVNNAVSELMNRPNADFGNKYEIMDVLTQAVRNGNDPQIVASQRQTARCSASNGTRWPF